MILVRRWAAARLLLQGAAVLAVLVWSVLGPYGHKAEAAPLLFAFFVVVAWVDVWRFDAGRPFAAF